MPSLENIPDRIGPPLELLECPSQVGHENSNSGTVVPLLHHIEGADRHHGRQRFLTCDGKQSAHNAIPFLPYLRGFYRTVMILAQKNEPP
jgi:hypothetical protein